MINNSQPYNVPKEIVSTTDLDEWIGKQFEQLGDDPPSHIVVLFFKKARSFCRGNHSLFEREDIDYYDRRYVYALMDNGWTIKQKTKGLNQEATRVFEEALRIIPNNPLACYRLGHLMRESEIGKAIGYFSQALDLSNGKFQLLDRLKLNSAQLINAQGLTLALVSKLVESFSNFDDPFYTSEQADSFRNLLGQTWRSHVVYTIHGTKPSKENLITDERYDDLLTKFSRDPCALVIDRFNERSLIRYQNQTKYLNDSDNKLNYLLQALDLEPFWEPVGTPSPNAHSKTVSRLNEDLERIGVSRDLLRVTYSQQSALSASSNITTHYFKSLLD